MDTDARLPEKSRGVGGAGLSGFSEIEIDFTSPEFLELAELFQEYWTEVNPEDPQEPVTHEGIKLGFTDATIAWYGLTGYRFMGYYNASSLVGFVIYQVVFDTVLFIRGMYVKPGYEGKGLGKGLVNSISEPFTRVYFQSRIKYPPTLMLQATKNYARKVRVDDDLITWEMTWNKGD